MNFQVTEDAATGAVTTTIVIGTDSVAYRRIARNRYNLFQFHLEGGQMYKREALSIPVYQVEEIVQQFIADRAKRPEKPARSGKEFDAKEDRYLLENDGKVGRREMAYNLRRSYNSVNSRIQFLKSKQIQK